MYCFCVFVLFLRLSFKQQPKKKKKKKKETTAYVCMNVNKTNPQNHRVRP